MRYFRRRKSVRGKMNNAVSYSEMYTLNNKYFLASWLHDGGLLIIVIMFII